MDVTNHTLFVRYPETQVGDTTLRVLAIMTLVLASAMATVTIGIRTGQSHV
jgi:hypothetical protein